MCMHSMAKVGVGKKQQLNLKAKRFHIFDGQTICIKQLKEENTLVHDKMQKWKESNSNLESEMKVCKIFWN